MGTTARAIALEVLHHGNDLLLHCDGVTQAPLHDSRKGPMRATANSFELLELSR